MSIGLEWVGQFESFVLGGLQGWRQTLVDAINLELTKAVAESTKQRDEYRDRALRAERQAAAMRQFLRLHTGAGGEGWAISVERVRERITDVMRAMKENAGHDFMPIAQVRDAVLTAYNSGCIDTESGERRATFDVAEEILERVRNA